MWARPNIGFLAAVALICVTAGSSQAVESPTPIGLEQLGARQPPDYTPRYAGQPVLIRGVVSVPPFLFRGYAFLPLEDSQYGAVLEVIGNGWEFSNYTPGDQIEVRGTVSSNAGMVTVRPSEIHRIGAKPVPTPQPVPPAEVLGFRHLGRLVHLGARVSEIGETVGGPYLLLATDKGDLRLFVPDATGSGAFSFHDLRVGDWIEATGIALQYCPSPPYNRWFELLVHDPAQVVRTGRARLVHPTAIAAGLAGATLLALLLWFRDRRLRGQRERLRRTYELGEQILSASSTEMILAQVLDTLPGMLGISRVALYIYNRGAKTLDPVAPVSTGRGAEQGPISLSSPPGGTQAGAAACFHYRTLLAIPDIDRSPFPIASEPGRKPPKSVLFVPMLSQGEVVGVLELDQDDKTRDFTPDEQALAQHLGNQIGVTVRLLDQRSVQEHLFRTEKLAAVGRLISGVVNELQQPLSSIAESADRALMKSRVTPAERDLLAIAAEAQKASTIVARLVSFATAEQGEVRPVCVTTLLRNLIEFREREWKASGIRVRDLTLADAMFVPGSQGQLEQAFLTLFLYAEQSLAAAEEKAITIRSSPLGKRLLVEIAFTAPPDVRPPQETAAVLSVTRSVIAGHGGEVRLIEKNNAEPRFEVELPLSARERGGAGIPPDSGRAAAATATILLIEPEETAQRQLRDQLAGFGYRVVPVTNADTALELSQRMRFDAAFSSIHAPGLNWVELSERLQSRVGAFVLLSDRYEAELTAGFEAESRFVLTRPIEDGDLQRVLASIDSPTRSLAT